MVASSVLGMLGEGGAKLNIYSSDVFDVGSRDRQNICDRGPLREKYSSGLADVRFMGN
jgi:hypothetical protein